MSKLQLMLLTKPLSYHSPKLSNLLIYFEIYIRKFPLMFWRTECIPVQKINRSVGGWSTNKNLSKPKMNL
jgi:hypothetical protein